MASLTSTLPFTVAFAVVMMPLLKKLAGSSFSCLMNTLLPFVLAREDDVNSAIDGMADADVRVV
jgi:hypothetical protein